MYLCTGSVRLRVSGLIGQVELGRRIGNALHKPANKRAAPSTNIAFRLCTNTLLAVERCLLLTNAGQGCVWELRRPYSQKRLTGGVA